MRGEARGDRRRPRQREANGGRELNTELKRILPEFVEFSIPQLKYNINKMNVILMGR
jgi:hypothetical protein